MAPTDSDPIRNPIADPIVEVVDTDAQSRTVVINATAEGVATVVINRPHRKNAFDAEVIGALNEAFETLEAADGVRVVFVRGAAGTFSAGADLDWMRHASTLTEADNREDAMAMARMLHRLYSLPMLTVALVEGAAFGGGAGLVAACDMAIATRATRFAFSEVRLGLVAATISPYVVQAIGARRARALFATARAFGADEALTLGLVDEVVEDGAGLHAARDRIGRAMLDCGPVAVAESKRLVEHVAGRKIDHGVLADTAHWIARVRVNPEAQEGVAAFLERRRAVWDVRTGE
jgi:methylglutaconyl-CoA hydratase